MKMKKIISIVLLFVTLSSISCSGQKEKKMVTIKEAIVDLYYAKYEKDYYSELERHPDLERELLPKNRVDFEKYLGHKDNIHVVATSGHMFRSYNIQIDEEYISEKIYGYYCGPWVFQEGSLYHFNDAFCDGIIDLEFVKTFDEFQKEHTIDELDEVYIEL